MFTASVGACPAATLVMRRSLPAEPIDNVFVRSATEPSPIATALGADAIAPPPIAAELLLIACAALPELLVAVIGAAVLLAIPHRLIEIADPLVGAPELRTRHRIAARGR